jgi:hypothetical protein
VKVGVWCAVSARRSVVPVFFNETKRPLGRPRRRWVDNIKMYPREIGWDGMDWMDRIWTSGGLW